MNRAMQIGDDENLAICEGIADMLRYPPPPSGASPRWARRRRTWTPTFRWMKKRFPPQLVYAVDIPEDMLALRLPKMTLQPLAENAIQHGFARKGGAMRVRGPGLDGRGILRGRGDRQRQKALTTR
jgi:hypothetical protein